MRTWGYLGIMDHLGVMETRWFWIQDISGFDSFFHLSGATGTCCPGISILLSSNLSADQLPLLTHSCCSFSSGLLRPSRLQAGRCCLLALGQLVAYYHPDSAQQFGLPGQDCLIVCITLPFILISIFGAAFPKQLSASVLVLWGPALCLAESTNFGIRYA